LQLLQQLKEQIALSQHSKLQPLRHPRHHGLPIAEVDLQLGNLLCQARLRARLFQLSKEET
jgi:hypothetical protein